MGLRRKIITNKVKVMARFNFMLQRLKKNSGMVSALKEAHDGMLPKNAITSDYDCLVLDWKLKENYHK